MQKQLVIRGAIALLMMLLISPGVSACTTVISGVGQPGQAAFRPISTAAINTDHVNSGKAVVVTVQNATPGAFKMLILPAPNGVGIGNGTIIARGKVTTDGTATVRGNIPPTGFYGQCEIIVYDEVGGEIFAFLVTVT